MEIVALITGLLVGFSAAYFIHLKFLKEQKIKLEKELSNLQNEHQIEIKRAKVEHQQAEAAHQDHASESICTISHILDESADNSDSTAESLSRVTTQIQTVSEMIKMIIDLSDSAGRIANTGMENIDSVVNDLSELEKSNAELSLILDRFNAIQQRTVAIRYVGEEAEMLALNAAIEAARAGDAGRGFAVVADSMKSLAQNSQNTTNEILGIVKESDSILKEVADSVARRGNKLEHSIEGLVKNFNQINISVDTIKSHTKLISSGSDNISELMQHSASTTKTALESLIKQLSELVSSITRVKVIDLSPAEAKDQWHQFDEVIDVRRAEELETDLGSIEGVRLSTLQTDFKEDVNQLVNQKKYLFICRSGGRSSKAAQMAHARGIEHVYNLDGGMLEWRKQGF
jgi:rhodanese-related sulfurtransferase/uncharacterized membrane-anchored protein YhcB (DUF1043 family)